MRHSNAPFGVRQRLRQEAASRRDRTPDVVAGLSGQCRRQADEEGGGAQCDVEEEPHFSKLPASGLQRRATGGSYKGLPTLWEALLHSRVLEITSSRPTL
ncbi:MAG: hypothetical protein AB7K04_07985, partial [Pseudorhodoplanes sp.]